MYFKNKVNIIKVNDFYSVFLNLIFKYFVISIFLFMFIVGISFYLFLIFFEDLILFGFSMR